MPLKALITSSALLLGVLLHAAGRPNIIFILTDDQGYGDLSAHGNPVLKTPNLDRLRSESVRFEDFHVSPTCSPTRWSARSPSPARPRSARSSSAPSPARGSG